MQVVIIGTDPAGLYLACRLRTLAPATDLTIIDTGLPGRDGAPPHILTNPLKPKLELADSALWGQIMALSQTTQGAVVVRDAERTAAPGHAYTFIAAALLRDLLLKRAQALGVRIEQSTAAARDMPATADVIVIADGAESPTRTAMSDGFKPRIEASRTLHLLVETDQPPKQLMYLVRSTPAGAVHAMHYPDGAKGRLIVEAPRATVTAAGMEGASTDRLIAWARDLFEQASGARVVSTGASWRPFALVRNGTWTHGNATLLGAAAYNAHPSIGLGVRSGLEDADALATLLTAAGGAHDALAKFENLRRPRADSLQRASAASQLWLEHVDRYMAMPTAQFAYALLTRSMRLNHESMRGLAPELTEAVETVIAGDLRSKTSNRPVPPMFVPITLRGLIIPNRIVMSPMCMHSAIDEDGTVGDFHLVHYGSRAVGGAGLIITEMTDVEPQGRIAPGCAGMYKPEHVAAWRRVTDFVHTRTEAKIGVQLGHAGRKGGEARPWERAVPKGTHWPTIAPSAIPFAASDKPPREMTRADMDRLVAAYGNAARMADQAGFDFIELHFAHGYLLSTFISPLSNKRTDQYGGSLANRLRFPMEVFEAVRAAWPQDKPSCVRISAYDWAADGTSIDDAIEIGRRLKAAGNDILSVSTGGVIGARPATGRLYQAGFSDQIRNELKTATMNVGAMASHGDINAMIAAGRADMCALARGHLFDPYFTRHAAFQQGYQDLAWPPQYERGPSLTMRDF